jgi:UDP-N-acetylglucosamine 4,6-dehydratase/UDP-glucose 4-epimerase|tara:strand:- start:15 stop:875 length:861 start_codon:yes stop_codon:yes gene_type:complete
MEKYNFAGKQILITGGSGFLGNDLVARLHGTGCRVRVMSRNEGNLIKLQMRHPWITILSGDVSDRYSVQQAMKGVDGVFHLAAFKHVGLAETQSRECVKSNTIGSLILLEEAAKENVDFVLGISTDKAAQVAGVYGASKRLMERLFVQFENNYPDITFRIVRYGNVLYSTGSVLCIWKDLIEQGKKVIVTEPKATRFFWTVEQAIDLIFDCFYNAKDSNPYCPDMKSMRIDDLLQAMVAKYADGKEIPIEVIGLQPGENLHEKVLEEGLASNEVEHFTVEEITELI